MTKGTMCAWTEDIQDEWRGNRVRDAVTKDILKNWFRIHIGVFVSLNDFVH